MEPSHARLSYGGELLTSRLSALQSQVTLLRCRGTFGKIFENITLLLLSW